MLQDNDPSKMTNPSGLLWLQVLRLLYIVPYCSIHVFYIRKRGTVCEPFCIPFITQGKFPLSLNPTALICKIRVFNLMLSGSSPMPPTLQISKVLVSTLTIGKLPLCVYRQMTYLCLIHSLGYVTTGMKWQSFLRHFIYLFCLNQDYKERGREKGRERGREKERLIHLLVHFPNGCYSQSWTGLKLGARSFF